MEGRGKREREREKGKDDNIQSQPYSACIKQGGDDHNDCTGSLLKSIPHSHIS